MDKNFSKLLQTSILIASLIMLPFPLAAPAKSTNETAYLKDLQSGISNLGSSILQMQAVSFGKRLLMTASPGLSCRDFKKGAKRGTYHIRT